MKFLALFLIFSQSIFATEGDNLFCYHVTPQMNLANIRQEGLQPRYGGVSNGMCSLVNDPAFIEQSQNYVHVGQNWESAKRYCEHMVSHLKDEQGIGMFPVVLKCRCNSHVFEEDPHDREGLKTKQPIHPNDLFLLGTFLTWTTPNICPDSRANDGMWVPIQLWIPKLIVPAYPDDDGKPFLRALQFHRIHPREQEFLRGHLMLGMRVRG